MNRLSRGHRPCLRQLCLDDGPAPPLAIDVASSSDVRAHSWPRLVRSRFAGKAANQLRRRTGPTTHHIEVP
jgi:hypothetical protein